MKIDSHFYEAIIAVLLVCYFSFHFCSHLAAREFVYQVQIKLGWTKQQAAFFGRLLNQKDIIHNVANQKPFDDDDEWWRFQVHNQPTNVRIKKTILYIKSSLVSAN